MEKIKTFNEHRRRSNSQEAQFYELASKWKGQYNNIFDLAILGSRGNGTPTEYLTDREEQIVFSTLQWLGSPAGQSFLEQVGYIKKEL
jgi:hypothetical protein